jgi:hypothetical protein
MIRPDLTFIVSAFDDPPSLACVLWNLAGQTHRNIEIIVTDNTEDPKMARAHLKACNQVGKYFPVRYVRTARKIKSSDCYYSGEYAARNLSSGTFLCFPCDDSYYMPQFAQRMLGAAFRNSWDFVECVGLAGPDMTGIDEYAPLVGHTIKTAFIIRAELFRKLGYWSGKHPRSGPTGADRLLGDEVRRRKASWGKLNQILVVHN